MTIREGAAAHDTTWRDQVIVNLRSRLEGELMARVTAVQAVTDAVGDERSLREEALTRERQLAEEGIQTALHAVRVDRAADEKRTADRILELSAAITKEQRCRSDANALLEQRIRCEEEAREVADLAVQRACTGDVLQVAAASADVDVPPKLAADVPEGASTIVPAHWGDLPSDDNDLPPPSARDPAAAGPGSCNATHPRLSGPADAGSCPTGRPGERLR